MNIKNILGMAKAVFLAHFMGKRTPVNVMWRITNKCNSKCKYCMIRDRDQRELSTYEILNLIDQMAECGTLRIGFVGGEALLRKDFGKILDYVKKKNIYITLVSNGYLIPKKIDLIRKLDCLILSFDGKKLNHERDREIGAYEKVMNAIKTVSKEDINLLTNTVLTKYNLDDLDFILETAREYVFKCTFNLLQGAYDMLPENKKYRETIQRLIDAKKKGMPIVLSFKTLNLLKKWKDYKEFISLDPMENFRCWAGKLIFNINTDGSIAPCDILSNLKKNHPNCVKLGLKKAISVMEQPRCKSCTCTHVLEYNHIFSLSFPVIWDWSKVIFKHGIKKVY